MDVLFCVAVIVSIAVVFCSDCMVKETNNHDILNSKATESKSDLTNQHNCEVKFIAIESRKGTKPWSSYTTVSINCYTSLLTIMAVAGHFVRGFFV